MAKDKKYKPTKKRPDNYEEKLKVKGSFLDIMKAAVKDANSKEPKKKKS